ncbi:MAG: hypothetical protein MK171_07555 [Pirellulales bacterium]|nr:hypothetical protein [Pirellulales bacterium]
MSFLALDIGGANLKIASSEGFARSQSFCLWQRHTELATTLSDMLAHAPAADRLALTMTGELADCFATKAEGVDVLVAAVEQAAGPREVGVYATDGRLVSTAEARAKPLLVAASNWHALAGFAARYCQARAGLLVDLGSTTCDIIPIENGVAAARGRTDPERLAGSELVYTGVTRSPVCAVVGHLPWRGKPCRVAQEMFATTADAYLVLGDIAESIQNGETADGRPRTKAFSHARLARSICADTTMFSWADAEMAAQAVCDAQLQLLHSAIQKVTKRMESAPQTIVISGQGEFVLRRLLALEGFSGRRVWLSDELGLEISQAACAYALAVLAEEGAIL